VAKKKPLQGPDQPTFKTPQAAAISAMRAHNRTSIKTNKEALGLIVKTKDGRYRAVGGIVPGKPKNKNDAKLRYHKGETPVALWHTHGAAMDGADIFSDGDVSTVKQFGMPLYLANPDGDMRVLKPGDPRIGFWKNKRRAGMAEGTLLEGKAPTYTDNSERRIDRMRNKHKMGRYVKEEPMPPRPVTEQRQQPAFMGPLSPSNMFALK
jgi:hypothetical protein